MKRTIFEVRGVKVEELSGPDIPEWSGYERREGPLLQIDAPGGALLTMEVAHALHARIQDWWLEAMMRRVGREAFEAAGD